MRRVIAIAAGIVLAAALVFAAPAAASQFHSSVKGAALDGSQQGEHVFTIAGNTVTCETAEFTGTADPSGTSETQEVHPSYANCTAFGFSEPKINTAGCRLKFDANTSEAELKSCTAGAGGITILGSSFFSTCEVEVPNQVGINGVSYANMVPRTTFTVQLNSTNISYKVLKSSGFCPLPGAGKVGKDAKYVGLTSIKADGGAAEFWLE